MLYLLLLFLIIFFHLLLLLLFFDLLLHHLLMHLFLLLLLLLLLFLIVLLFLPDLLFSFFFFVESRWDCGLSLSFARIHTVDRDGVGALLIQIFVVLKILLFRAWCRRRRVQSLLGAETTLIRQSLAAFVVVLAIVLVELGEGAL